MFPSKRLKCKSSLYIQHLERLNDVTTQGQPYNTRAEAKVLKKLIKAFIRDTNNAIEVPLSVQSLAEWGHYLQGNIKPQHKALKPLKNCSVSRMHEETLTRK